MKFNILKYYYKLFDNKKYKRLKEQNKIQKSIEIFENEYKSYLYEIKSKKKSNEQKFFFINYIHIFFFC